MTSRCFLPSKQSGLSMIELMISMAIGLVILSAVLYIYSSSRQGNRVQEQSARMLDSARFALEIIGHSIRESGFADISSAQTSNKTVFSGTAITGTNGATGAADVLTLQRDGALNDRGCLGTQVSVTGRRVQESFNLNTASYELRCDEDIAATPGAVGNGTAIISGVEDFQVLYGVDTNNNQSVDTYKAAPGNWSQVVSARVCLQLRSMEAGVLTSGSQTFLNCAGALSGDGSTSTMTDGRLHRVFVATYSLRNRVTSIP